MRRQNPDRSVEESKTNAAARRAKGEFMRGVSQFRSALGSTAFPAEAHRYHLYVALNCPWSHRVTLARNLLGLQHSITLDVAFPNRTDEADPEGPNHWQFAARAHASDLFGIEREIITKDTRGLAGCYFSHHGHVVENGRDIV